jgi:hypothetical protein
MDWFVAVVSFLLVILFPPLLLWLMTKRKSRIERK